MESVGPAKSISNLTNKTMNKNRQQIVADVLKGYERHLASGEINQYELAGKILEAITDADIAALEKDLCSNCREHLKKLGWPLCEACMKMGGDTPQTVDAVIGAGGEMERSESWSEGYRNAH
jgi:hypothetical protein